MYGSIEGNVWSTDLNNKVIYRVVESIIQPNYRPFSNVLLDDIALLRVEPVDQSTPDLVIPICINREEVDQVMNTETVCYVAGYGMTEEQPDKPAEKLNYAPMTLVDWSTCNATNYHYGIQELHQDHFDHFFCAGEINVYDSCGGDSGGPLMCRPVNSCTWSLVGLVSFGPSPCGQGYGVYSKVSSYVDFIEKHTGPSTESSTEPNCCQKVTVRSDTNVDGIYSLVIDGQEHTGIRDIVNSAGQVSVTNFEEYQREDGQISITKATWNGINYWWFHSTIDHNAKIWVRTNDNHSSDKRECFVYNEESTIPPFAFDQNTDLSTTGNYTWVSINITVDCVTTATTTDLSSIETQKLTTTIELQTATTMVTTTNATTFASTTISTNAITDPITATTTIPDPTTTIQDITTTIQEITNNASDLTTTISTEESTSQGDIRRSRSTTTTSSAMTSLSQFAPNILHAIIFALSKL